MPDLTPPDPGPLDDATRARIRARLTEATARGDGRPVGRWLVPAAAAAAVLVIAIGVAVATLTRGGDGSAPPLGSPTTSAPSAPPADELPSTPGLRPSKPPTASPLIPPPADDATLPGAGAAGCPEAVAEQLRGAEQVVSWDLPGGPAGIWVAGDRSVFCEFSGGVATTHRVGPTETAGEMDAEQLRFSTTFYLISTEQPVSSFIAGGPVPQGVTGIVYRFPDGHEEPAVIRTDDQGRRWWAMAYVTDGPLASDRVNFLDLDPVLVVVSARDSIQQRVTLQWGRDDCAQANHGC